METINALNEKDQGQQLSKKAFYAKYKPWLNKWTDIIIKQQTKYCDVMNETQLNEFAKGKSNTSDNTNNATSMEISESQ